MNLRSVDLNLLVVLDALLDEAHVSRAALRVGLSQPATSAALERCRHLFRDRLLERGSSGMRLTPAAEALREPLRQALGAISQVIGAEALDLATLRQTVRIAMADVPAASIAPALCADLARTAPGIDLVIHPWRDAATTLSALARGSIDLAVSVLPPPEAGFRRRELLRETYVIVMRDGHPAAAAFDFDAWLFWPHILVSATGEKHGALDDALAALGRTRRVGIVVPSFMMVPPLLAASDFIAMIPRGCLSPNAKDTMAIFRPPIEVAGFPLHIGWHLRRDGDLAVRHVAAAIERLLAAPAPQA